MTRNRITRPIASAAQEQRAIRAARARTIAQIKAHPAVAELYAEDDNGWWADLAEGYRDTEADTTQLHERTIAEIAYRLREYVRKDDAPAAPLPTPIKHTVS